MISIEEKKLGRRLARLILLLLNPFLAQCSAVAEDPTEVKVGAIYAMTGDWASWGKNCQQATELALAELKRDAGAPKIKLVLEDSPNAKPINALSAFKKLTDIDRVRFILGPMSPEEYAALAPLADRKGIPLLPFVSSRVAIPAAVFMWMDPETQARRIADYVASRHKSVAVLSSNQDWDVQVAQAFKRRLLERGVDVPVLEELPSDSSEVRSPIAKLSLVKVDAIFVTSYLLFPHYLKALRAAQIIRPMYGIELDQSAISSVGHMSEGLQFIAPAVPQHRFRESYKTMWGAEPDIPASQCYDSVMILRKAISAGVKDKESFATYFKSQPAYTGASGEISIQKSKTIMSTDLFEVKNGKITYLRSIGD
jgi:branched-chain amino acid transport system substrate-binding protein